MKKMTLYLAALLFGLAARAGLVVSGLQCEQLSDPSGIDIVHPRLSWRLSGEGKDIVETGWQLLVASTPELLARDKGDLWTSPRVADERSRMIVYRGAALKSGMVCYWKVKVWTNAGVSSWSDPARWSMGLLGADSWKGRWIGYDGGFPWDSVSKFSRLSARYLRKEFESPGSLKRATLYIAGLGHYCAYINGQAIGDQVLAESPTDYTRSVKYNSFDVTADCRKGVNAIGVVLGNGRYFTMRPRYKPQKIKEFGFPKLLLQLDLEDGKGHHRLIVSDTSWKFTANGPIRSNNEYDGEEYDATKEMPGWSSPGFDDSRWMRAERVAVPGGRLSAQMDEPMKVMERLRPVSMHALPDGDWILDMGQNMAGWLQLKVKGKRGQRIKLRFAETLQPDGSLYTANLRDARATDSYTLRGEGEEVWHPSFVFHGFRYVAVSGWPGQPALTDFEGQVVYDDLATTGRIVTSDTLFNRILRNAWWGINSNYKGMPVDCPQRNERMPWLGDRATGSLGESYFFANENLYAKWLDDIEQAQKPDGSLPDVAPAYWNYYSDNMTWPGTYLLVASMLYEQYGDSEPVRRHYESMKKWLWYMRDKYERNGIMTKDKYGDWCVPPESPTLIHTRDSARMTDGRLIATAYYYDFLRLMARFAVLLDKPDEYTAKAMEVKAAFNRQFLHGESYGNGSVTSNLLPLCFGIVPEGDRAAVASKLIARVAAEGHIATGVIGTGWLMQGLTELGRADLAWKLASNKDYPGWGYMAEHGATTIWELWNGNTADPAMNSQNHVMLLGDLLTWSFEDLAGIAPAEPGFKKIRLQPVFPAGLDSVNAAYETPYGEVKSAWHRVNGRIDWDIAVPPNTRAVVGEQEIGSGEYHYDLPDPGIDSSILKKAASWVASLKLNDPKKEARITAVIAAHLEAVRNWHNSHPHAKVPDPEMPRAIHDSLLTGLRRDLDPEQVNALLDKYTMGKVQFTLNGYKAIVPDLTPKEESVILANLEQAREQAVDYKNSKQISAVFEIYKTRNEQYLDSNGRNWHALFKAYVDAQKAKKAIVRSEFLYDTASFPECHAATIAETPHGLVAAFFGGTKERNPDVCIYVCRKDQGTEHWTAPVDVANGIQNDSLRYACWNPVLYQIPGGDLLLFYKVGPSPAKWKGWLIRSKDGGVTWTKPWPLPEGFLGPIKDKPVLLRDGTLLCPVSVEGHGWSIHFELTRDGGRTWQMAAPVPAADSIRVIQPTILLHTDGTIQALCRSENRAIYSTTSTDNGHSWSPLAATMLPNNNSGIDGATLADGRQLLVYNHVLPPPGQTKGERSPLNVALSDDGFSWHGALVLESDHEGQYSYPSVIQGADGKVHIVYTWRRKKIKYVELDPSKLK